MRLGLGCLSVFVCAFASGCLSNVHKIPKGELERLAQTDPLQRGDKVRVIQSFNTSRNPPPAGATQQRPVTQQRTTARQGEAPDSDTCVSLQVDVADRSWATGGRNSRNRRAESGRRSGRGSGEGRPATVDHRQRPSGTSSRPPKRSGKVSGRKGSSSKSSGSSNAASAEGAAVLAVAVVASAAVLAVVAAGSEGARYDGWAQIEDEHPVHLYGPRNEYKKVALDELSEEDAAWAKDAYVRKSEGSWKALGRAPLNRTGPVYSVFLGAGEIGDAMGGSNVGARSHIQIGYFPIHEFGVVGDLSFGWGGGGGDPYSDAPQPFLVSTGLEMQILPLQAGRVHGGGYGQFGYSQRNDAAGGGESNVFSTGALLQLDLTTRLALSARAGVRHAHERAASEMSLGISIY